MIQENQLQLDPMTGLPMQTTNPPIPSNMMGTAIPVFNPLATQAATNIYGDVNSRQNSLGANAPLFDQQF